MNEPSDPVGEVEAEADDSADVSEWSPEKLEAFSQEEASRAAAARRAEIARKTQISLAAKRLEEARLEPLERVRARIDRIEERLARESRPEPSYDQRRSRRKHDVRGKTIDAKRITKTELDVGRILYPEDDDLPELPVTRAECADLVRPCPFVSCKFNLYLDVHPITDSIRVNFPDREPDEMPPEGSCVLDVADRGVATLEEVGALMNVTRERIRQIEAKAYDRLARKQTVKGLASDHLDMTVTGRPLPGAEREPRLGPDAAAAEEEERGRKEAREVGSLRELLDHTPTPIAPPVRHLMVGANGQRVGQAVGGRLVHRARGYTLPLPWGSPFMARAIAKGAVLEKKPVPASVQWFGEDGEETIPRELPPMGTKDTPTPRVVRAPRVAKPIEPKRDHTLSTHPDASDALERADRARAEREAPRTVRPGLVRLPVIQPTSVPYMAPEQEVRRLEVAVDEIAKKEVEVTEPRNEGHPLTPRQQRILEMVNAGARPREIAEATGSPRESVYSLTTQLRARGLVTTPPKRGPNRATGVEGLTEKRALVKRLWDAGDSVGTIAHRTDTSSAAIRDMLRTLRDEGVLGRAYETPASPALLASMEERAPGGTRMGAAESVLSDGKVRTTREIAKYIGANEETTRLTLRRLETLGKAVRPDHGKWCAPPPSEPVTSKKQVERRKDMAPAVGDRRAQAIALLKEELAELEAKADRLRVDLQSLGDG